VVGAHIPAKVLLRAGRCSAALQGVASNCSCGGCLRAPGHWPSWAGGLHAPREGARRIASTPGWPRIAAVAAAVGAAGTCLRMLLPTPTSAPPLAHANNRERGSCEQWRCCRRRIRLQRGRPAPARAQHQHERGRPQQRPQQQQQQQRQRRRLWWFQQPSTWCGAAAAQPDADAAARGGGAAGHAAAGWGLQQQPRPCQGAVPVHPPHQLWAGAAHRGQRAGAGVVERRAGGVVGRCAAGTCVRVAVGCLHVVCSRGACTTAAKQQRATHKPRTPDTRTHTHTQTRTRTRTPHRRPR
jgi:hypothetical protein